jgi:hypothetical protein
MCLAAALGLCASATAQQRVAASVPLVTLVRGNGLELELDRDRGVARVPVELGPRVRARRVSAQLTSVSIGQTEDRRLHRRLSARFVPAVNGHGPAISVRAELGRLRPGTFNLVVTLIGRRAGRRVRQQVDLSLILVPAKLREPAALDLRHLAGLVGTDPANKSLYLAEISGRSRLSHVVVEQDTSTASGVVSFPSNTTIRPGDVARLTPTLQGHFPIGTTTGTLQVRARELEQPVTVSFAVVTERSKWWIVVVALIGIVLGWVTRVLVRDQVARSTARLEALRLLRTIEEELGRRVDGGFQDRAGGLHQRLKVAISDSDDPGSLERTTSEIAAELQREIDVDRKARATALKRIASAEDLIGRGWKLPPAAAQDLRETGDALNGAEALLARGNVGAATAHVEKLEQRLARTVQERTQSLIDAIGRLVSEIPAQMPAPLPEAENLATHLRKLVDDYNAQTPRRLELGDALQQLHELSVAVDGVLGGLTAWANEAPSRSPDQADRQKRMLEAIAAARRDPLSGIDAVATALSVIVKKASGRGDRARTDEGPLIVVGTPAPTPAIHTAALPAIDPTVVGPAKFKPDGTVPEGIFQTRGQLFLATLLQTALVGVVLVLLAYGLFEGTWVGTLDDFATVFFWAYGLDIGTQVALDAARQRWPGAAPPQPAGGGTTP